MSEYTPRLIIHPEHLAIVRGILHAHVPDREVWAFGSRVAGRVKPYSDLDLAILGDIPLPLDTQAALAEAFSESDLPWRVDVVDWARASEDFRRIIAAHHVVVQHPEIELDIPLSADAE